MQGLGLQLSNIFNKIMLLSVALPARRSPAAKIGSGGEHDLYQSIRSIDLS
ncbi:hypothetical protein AEST_24540 [Alishewanella aestuarii B11]|uniref:Uncharacterized protein n=1 Tax=Alishewanella aestuarii B11 TaxID=1197174 RepID=J2IDM4_9ALTE|nr:hypothetical protein AEST_24540 [Alishewanella aestuarii B11]